MRRTLVLLLMLIVGLTSGCTEDEHTSVRTADEHTSIRTADEHTSVRTADEHTSVYTADAHTSAHTPTGFISVLDTAGQGDDLTDLWTTPTGWRGRPKPDDEVRAIGRKRAEVEYRNGWAEIEIFGVKVGNTLNWGGYVNLKVWEIGVWSYIDNETGLYFRSRGDAFMTPDDIESEAYNKRIKELVASNGLPQKAKDLKERFNRLGMLMERKPNFTWEPLLWSTGSEKLVPTKLGPYEVIAKISDFSVTTTSIRISSGDKTIRIYIRPEGKSLFTTLLPELDILILKDSGRFGRDDLLTFIDIQHEREMCSMVYKN